MFTQSVPVVDQVEKKGCMTSQEWRLLKTWTLSLDFAQLDQGQRSHYIRQLES